jgi:hypothetical protein
LSRSKKKKVKFINIGSLLIFIQKQSVAGNFGTGCFFLRGVDLGDDIKLLFSRFTQRVSFVEKMFPFISTPPFSKIYSPTSVLIHFSYIVVFYMAGK